MCAIGVPQSIFSAAASPSPGVRRLHKTNREPRPWRMIRWRGRAKPLGVGRCSDSSCVFVCLFVRAPDHRSLIFYFCTYFLLLHDDSTVICTTCEKCETCETCDVCCGQRTTTRKINLLQADRGCAGGHFFVGGGGGVWAKKFVMLRGLRISEKKEILRKPTVL